MSIRTRIFQGLAAHGFGQIVTIAINLVSVPIFLHFWGVELYGEWLLINTIPAYLNMSDVGFTTVSANEMTMLVSREDRPKALSIFQSTWIFICITSIAIFGIAVLLVWLLPFESWFNLRHLVNFELIAVFILMALYVLAMMQMKLLMAGFRCEGYYALGAFVTTISLLVEYLVVAGVIYLGGTPVHVALSFLITKCFGFICIRILLIKRGPWIKYGFEHATIATVKRLARPAFAYMAMPFSRILHAQGLIAVIGFFLGSTAIVIFSTTRTVVNAGYQLMTMINHTVWPEISMAYGNNNMERARKLHRTAFKTTFIMSLFSAAGLYFAGEWIIRTWTMGKVIVPPDFLHLMMAVLVANALWYTSSMVPIAINRHERLSIYYLGVTILLLLISLWMVPLLHLNGAALVLIGIHLLMSCYVVRLALGLLHDDFPGFLRFIIALRLYK